MRADFAVKMNVLETLTVGVADVPSSGNSITHSSFGATYSRTDTDPTAPNSIYSGQQLTGTQTIDLTALATANGTKDCTGKKLRGLVIINPSTNTGPLTIGPAVSNPYPLFGTGNSKAVQLGGRQVEDFYNGLAAVSGTVKAITITPNNPADVYQIGLLLG